MQLDMNKLVGLMECGAEPVNYGDGWKVIVNEDLHPQKTNDGFIPVETTVILQAKRLGFCVLENEPGRTVARMRKVA